MTNKILLRGCAPEPLIHYLKALGVMRLVAEQLDKEVRGAWTADGFLLETTVTEDELIDFFLNKYEPTPIVAPWNGGSGFYDGDDTSGLDAILSFEKEQLKNYQETIRQIFSFPELPSVTYLTLQDLLNRVQETIDKSTNKEGKEVKELTNVIDVVRTKLKNFDGESALLDKTVAQLEELKNSNKEEARKLSDLLQPVKKIRTIVKRFERSSGKDIIIQACRNRLDEKCVEWLDATVVLSDSDAESPILGSGGNDGRLDFTKAFMLHLKEAIPDSKLESYPQKYQKFRDTSEQRLKAALFADTIAQTEKELVGQFYPAAAGGVNSTQGVSDSSFVNPWDFILGIEGCLVLASATVRQLAAGARSKASFPFTVRSSKIGFGSLAESEDIKAETWLPLWSALANYAEISHIFKEGRVQFSQSRKIVGTGFDFARAIAELGVDRGIDAFQRYAFTKRFGKNHFATSLGVFEVKEKPLVSLLTDLDKNRWLEKVISATRENQKPEPPPRFVRTRKQVEEAIFKLCSDGSNDSLRAVLIALANLERELSNGISFCSKKGLSPLANLSAKWAWEIREKSDEFYIAQALASIMGDKGKHALRENLESVEYKSGRFDWSSDSTSAIWSTGDLAENLSSVLQRRSIDARKNGLSHPPMHSERFASLDAVAAFLNGETDDERLEDYLFALSLINWQNAPEREARKASKPTVNLPRIYALFKLLFLPKGKLKLRNKEEIPIKHEPSIVPLLRAERIEDALEIAERRLRASGVVPLTRDFYYPKEMGARLAAALLIPIDQTAIKQIAKLILPDIQEI